MSFKGSVGVSWVVRWSRLCNPIARGTGWIPGWGTKILHLCREAKKKKKNEKVKYIIQKDLLNSRGNAAQCFAKPKWEKNLRKNRRVYRFN